MQRRQLVREELVALRVVILFSVVYDTSGRREVPTTPGECWRVRDGVVG